jgi:hypothetical protein
MDPKKKKKGRFREKTPRKFPIFYLHWNSLRHFIKQNSNKIPLPTTLLKSCIKRLTLKEEGKTYKIIERMDMAMAM